LLLAENRRVTLFVSRKIIAEVREVLSREHIRQRFDTVTDERAASFIDRVRKVARQIKTVRRHFNYQERDVKDEPYINLAVEVRARSCCSR
jgi:predicted nucleic acid-binding protein